MENLSGIVMSDSTRGRGGASAEMDARLRAALAGDWYHSHEEDERDQLVYRPASYELPPARGARESLRLSIEGGAGVGTAGPDDRSIVASGDWSVEGGLLTVEHDGGTQIFEIESVDSDRLVLRRSEKGHRHGQEQ